MKTCAEVMTHQTVYCFPEDLASRAAQLMQSANIGSVPVVENKPAHKLVGIVTDRDLALQLVAQGRDTLTTKVEAVMTRQIVTCQAGDDVQQALDAMAEHQLRRIPIVDQEQRLIGIIAQADVATRVNQPQKTATLVKEISQAAAK